MAEHSDFRVGLLADNEPNRRWTGVLPTGVGRLKTRSLAGHRGELHVYVLWAPALGGALDVVILPGWETPAAWQLLLEAKLRRVRTVAFYESASGSHRFSAGPVAALRRAFFRSVDAIVTVGAASEAAVLGFGVRPEQIVSSQNTVDVAAIQAAVARVESRPDRADRYAYVGQLIHRKNVDSLIDAFATLPGSAHLVVAGEGPEEQVLRAEAAAAGLADRVEFLGYVPYPDVPALFAQVSTLVLPSRSEVYGLVVTEALAAGLQVVVTENCGVYADVRDLPGVYGAQPTKESLAEAMLRSAQDWTGPLDQPVVLARTPEAMAHDVLRACAIAIARGVR
jgi:glycosyltransferase involved in cell wall biosynthesis